MTDINCLNCKCSEMASDGKVVCQKDNIRFSKDSASLRSCWDFSWREKKLKHTMTRPSGNDIVQQIGTPATLEQLAEECCELGQAALKLARKLRGENPTPKSEVECRNALREEMADVLVCMEALSLAGVTTKEAVDEIADEKRKRWSERLKEVKQ